MYCKMRPQSEPVRVDQGTSGVFLYDQLGETRAEDVVHARADVRIALRNVTLCNQPIQSVQLGRNLRKNCPIALIAIARNRSVGTKTGGYDSHPARIDQTSR